MIGAIPGLVAAGLIGWALFAALLQLNSKIFFQVTS
jgi:high-affinity Fe2+/Pb2+ permease